MPLPREHLLDELATAYVQIIAAAAGATIAIGQRDYGVDGTLKQIVRSRSDRFTESGFAVDFQLKGTTVAKITEDVESFDLKARNYDLIVTREGSASPYFLFLVCFPSDIRQWVTADHDRLILNASAFWWTYSGVPTKNARSVRLAIPTKNRLTFAALETILRASAERYL